MNELEINYSEYRESKNDYFSKRMDERFTFSNGHELTMSELVPHNNMDHEDRIKSINPNVMIDRYIEENGDGIFF